MAIGSIKTLLDRLSAAGEDDLMVEYREVDGKVVLPIDTVAMLAGLIKSGGTFALNDSDGKRNALVSSTGQTALSTYQANLSYIANQLLGWYGNIANKSPLAFLAGHTTHAADGSGNLAAAQHVAAGGAGKKNRLVALRVKTGSTNASGTVTVANTTAGTIFQLKNDVISDTLWITGLNVLCGDNETVTVEASGITASDTIDVMSVVRVENS